MTQKTDFKDYFFRTLFLACFCLGLGLIVPSCRPNDVIYDYSIRETHTEKDLPILQNVDIPKELNLQDIIEIAITRNLDIEVKKMEWEVQHERATGEKLKMLPTLIFNGEHSLRNTKPTVLDVTAAGATPTQSTSRRVNRISTVKDRLLYISRKSYEFGEGDESIVLGFQADSLIAQIEAYKAYGDARVALEQINNSMGIPGYFLEDQEESVCCDLQ